ncbi:primosomal protein N' [Streptomonospora sp. S1-112]|uniref:Probable replication restart protein PriA n=1 Tax=Streptomonospora mangrovi TaxID=2883123 RepID=A0A9X3NNN2_9ACTN|nr:primosomal protein N' [Streptomonospora mangrovi]MDA0565381.1 primosomal protein N' [Streptomonospora mangrovi]
MTAQPDPDKGLLFDLPRPAAAGSPADSGATAGRGAAKAPKGAAGKAGPKPRRPAERDPVARVVVDTPLPHLDRLFDYQVPESMDDAAVPGCRVRVPFHGQLLSGFLLERCATSEFPGRLAYLHQVVSPEPVLTPEIAALARAVADRYAGTLSDVLRLAVPPRHARVEKEDPGAASPPPGNDAKAPKDGTATAHGTEPGAEGAPAHPPTEALEEDSPAPEADKGAAEYPAAADGVAAPSEEALEAVETAGHDHSARAQEGAQEAPDRDGARTPEGDRGAQGTAPDSGDAPATAPAEGSPSGAAAAHGRSDSGRGGGAGVARPAGETPVSASAGTAAGPDAPPGADAVLSPTAASPGAAGHGPAAVDEGGAVVPGSGGADSPGPSAPSGLPPDAASAEAAPPPPEPGPWADYPAGPSFVAALASGGAPRAVWSALPGPQWADAIAVAVAAALSAGRGAVVVVPDGRDVAAVDSALTRHLGEGRHVALTAGLGPAERYRRWLRVLRGTVRAVVGTRAAAFAPVRDLGLVAIWDDGDDVHSEPHAPYPHARTVLSMRAHRANAGALIGGFTRTTEAAQLVESGWAHPLAADRALLRERAPRVRATGDDSELARDEAARTARIPHLALRVAREAAQRGPVLVQVPRRGYLFSLGCASCRAPARCGACQGPLALRGAHAMPYCRWCGRIAGEWRCAECGGTRLRAGVVGARRTAEELGRAFPSLTVRTSGRDDVLTEVSERPALVVATPGAEPAARGGYAAAVLLDGWALLGRADLRAAEEALRRWCNAAALVRPADEGGQVVVVAEAALPAVQALVRWDPGGFAERELAERRELGFPPAVAMASVTGEAAHVRELLEGVRLPESAQVLGPVPVNAGASGPEAAPERALLRVPRPDIHLLAAALKAAASARSARKEEHAAQVRVDPLEVV